MKSARFPDRGMAVRLRGDHPWAEQEGRVVRSDIDHAVMRFWHGGFPDPLEVAINELDHFAVIER